MSGKGIYIYIYVCIDEKLIILIHLLNVQHVLPEKCVVIYNSMYAHFVMCTRIFIHAHKAFDN